MAQQLELFDLQALCSNTPVKPTHDILDIIEKNFIYNPHTGDIFTKHKKFFPINANISPRGYYRIYVGGSMYFSHHIAWFLHYREWPTRQLDHVNRDKTDNSIHNLRYANGYINTNNSERVHIDNRKYIYFYEGKYSVIIPQNDTLNRSRTYLGRFKSILDAIKARNEYLGVESCEVGE